VPALLGNDGSRLRARPAAAEEDGAFQDRDQRAGIGRNRRPARSRADLKDGPPFMSLGPRDTVSNKTFVIIIRGAVSRSLLILSSTFA